MNEARVELLTTTGTLWRAVEGGEREGFEIENNVWIIGNDTEAIVIDASHDAEAIARAVGDRQVHGILLTHGHEDHVNAAVEAAELLDAEILLHAADNFLWESTYPGTLPQHEIAHGDSFAVAGFTLDAVHTPGHTPGSVCFIVRDERIVFSGDTLFHGGPGATRWDYSSFPTIIESIERQLLTLPGTTQVLPGHGEGTTVAAESAQLQAYINRGW